jgi:hypothetical protein
LTLRIPASKGSHRCATVGGGSTASLPGCALPFSGKRRGPTSQAATPARPSSPAGFIAWLVEPPPPRDQRSAQRHFDAIIRHEDVLIAALLGHRLAV